jgi:hypothetical protein
MELKVSVTTKGKIFEGKAPEIIREQLTSAMYEATSFLEREVKKRTPTGVYGAKGGLVSTIHGEVLGKGTPMIKGIVGHGKGTYGDVLEKGRRAGKTWPPEGALLRWIEVKMGLDTVQAKRLEFIIRRKIGKKGFPGAQMFEKALDENMGKLTEIFDKAGFEITRELNA